MRIFQTAFLAAGLVVSVPAQTPPATLTLTLADAMQRARLYSQQLLSADLAARIATEEKIQAKAAILPNATWLNGFIRSPMGAAAAFLSPTMDRISTPIRRTDRKSVV